MQADAPSGIIGLGLIGMATAVRLLAAGLPVVGFDIDATRCNTFKESGGEVAVSSRELANRCQLVISRSISSCKTTQVRRLPLPMMSTQAGLLRAAIALKGGDSDSTAIIEAIRLARYRPPGEST